VIAEPNVANMTLETFRYSNNLRWSRGPRGPDDSYRLTSGDEIIENFTHPLLKNLKGTEARRSRAEADHREEKRLNDESRPKFAIENLK